MPPIRLPKYKETAFQPLKLPRQIKIRYIIELLRL